MGSFLGVPQKLCMGHCRNGCPSPMRTFCCDCPDERHLNEVFGNCRPQGVSDNLAIEEVLVGGAVEPALFRGNVGQIADPDLVQRLCPELLFQEILCDRERMLRIRRGFELLPDPPDSADTHFDAVGHKIALQSS
jgi:hypothetical protein